MTRFSLHGTRRRFEVAGNDRDGYRVRVYVRPVMDEWWAELLHFELFAVAQEAEALMNTIDAAPVLNLDYWWWHASPTHAWRSLQVPSTCKLSTEARPART